MLQVRRAQDRGHANHGWLDTHHTFSFANYFDPRFMGFRTLRVINEDRVTPGSGFGAHGHQDMEILSLVLEGQIAHKDSTGTVATLGPGEVQRMTAGTGVRHSEFNPSAKDGLHFLQIWIEPERDGLAPGYEQKAFPREGRQGRLQTVASRDGKDGALTIHQDVTVGLTELSKGQQVEVPLAPGRHAWVQVARGELTVNGERLVAGDGVAVSGEKSLTLGSEATGEALVFDLA